MTKIEWTESSWNPVTGCTPISPGCAHCYAKRMANRLRGRCGYPKGDPFKVTLRPDRLDQPLKWKKGRMIFVCSMGDLFHEDVPDEYIDRVFAIMAICRAHTFQILTKRPKRMADYSEALRFGKRKVCDAGCFGLDMGLVGPLAVKKAMEDGWPNVWMGTSVENQDAWHVRLPHILKTFTAVRWISAEPMLGPIDFGLLRNPDAERPYIDWIVCGGESGPGARPMKPAWARDIREQCREAGIPFFMKQMGGKVKVSHWEDIPDDLKIREYPHG